MNSVEFSDVIGQRMKFGLPKFHHTALFFSLVLSISGAQPPREILPPPLPVPPFPKQKLIVGVAVGPPFDIKGADGSWSGISVELWREIANELGLTYEFRETNLTGAFAGLAQGWLDVSVGPLSITAQREEVCDFTHAYFSSSLAAAVPASHVPGSARFLLTLFDPKLWWAILRIAIGLLAIMAAVAVLIWTCERRVNFAQFGGGGTLGPGLRFRAMVVGSHNDNSRLRRCISPDPQGPGDRSRLDVRESGACLRIYGHNGFDPDRRASQSRRCHPRP